MTGDSLVSTVVIAVLVLWTGATVLNSIPGLFSPKRHSVQSLFTFVPKWHLFAPDPNQHDYLLFYRLRDKNGSIRPWQDVFGTGYDPGLIGAFWNPGYYEYKAFFRIVNELLVSIEDDAIEADSAAINPSGKRRELAETDSDELLVEGDLELSLKYLTLLNLVVERCPSEQGDALQFSIARSSRRDAVEPVYVSPFHEIEE